MGRRIRVSGSGSNGRELRRHRQTGRRPPRTYAAIDLGTNNCRLLVARPTREGFRVIDAFSRIVRLGEGVHRSGRLSDDAIDRTIEALQVCAGKMRRRGVSRARCVATEACRRAVNGDGFLERVTRETGLGLEIISPDEEVQLAMVGCRPLIEPWARHVVILDIGGGSTEISWLKVDEIGIGKIVAWTSLPCGVVNLAETHGGDRIDKATYAKMIEDVTETLAPFEAQHQFERVMSSGDVQMIGTSGTVTTLAGIHLRLPHYDRNRVDGIALDFSDLSAATQELLSMDFEERSRVPCVGRERADLVVAGCAILDAVHAQWPVGRLSVADRGLREGMLLGMMDVDRHNGGAARHNHEVQQNCGAGPAN
jgi:exopolyphosphatase/guanosine-5'-triphosphate,3'-diphosphate pyrophosphatase